MEADTSSGIPSSTVSTEAADILSDGKCEIPSTPTNTGEDALEAEKESVVEERKEGSESIPADLAGGKGAPNVTETDGDLDYAYTRRTNEFTSEIFKIQIENLPSYCHVSDLKKLLAKLKMV